MKKVLGLSFVSMALYSQNLVLPTSYINNDIVEESNITKNISRIEVEKNSSKRFKSLIKEIGNIEIRGNKIDIRGMGEGINTKFYLDNVPLNSFDMPLSKLNYINMGEIEEIEILYGAGSVLYGNGAVGGVISVKRNSFESLDINNNISYTKNSFNGNILEFSGGTYLFNEKVTFQTNYLKKEMESYGKNDYEEVEKFEVITRYILNPYEIYTLSLSNISSEFELPKYIKTNYYKQDNFYLDDFIKIDENNYFFSYKNTYDSHLNFFFDGSYSEKDYFSQNNFEKGSIRIVEDYSFFLRPKLIYYYGFASNLILAYDFSVEKNNIEQKSNGLYISENNKNSNALYFYNTYAIDLIDLVGGFRYEQNKYNVSGREEVFSNTAFDIGGKYYYGVEGNIFINFSTAFRTPNMNELSYTSTSLKSQKSYNFDLGINEKRGNNLISIGFFTIVTEDEIFYNPVANDGHGINVNMQGKNLRVGLEYINERKYDKVTLKDSIMLIDTRVLDGKYRGKSVPGVAPVTYKFYGNYKLNDNFHFWLSGKYTNSYYHYGDYENFYDKIKYSVLFDLGLDYNYQKYKIFGGIDNITNELYYDYAGYVSGSSYYYTAQGRRYYIGLKVSF